MTSNKNNPIISSNFYMGDTVPLIVNLGHLILDHRNCIREYERHHAQLPIQYAHNTI